MAHRISPFLRLVCAKGCAAWTHYLRLGFPWKELIDHRLTRGVSTLGIYTISFFMVGFLGWETEMETNWFWGSRTFWDIRLYRSFSNESIVRGHLKLSLKTQSGSQFCRTETLEPGSVREVILLLGCMVTSLREFWRVLYVEFIQRMLLEGDTSSITLDSGWVIKMRTLWPPARVWAFSLWHSVHVLFILSVSTGSYTARTHRVQYQHVYTCRYVKDICPMHIYPPHQYHYDYIVLFWIL